MPQKENIRIVQLIDSLEPGGAERMAVNYANALAERIAFSGLIATRAEGDLKAVISKKVDYLFLNKKSNVDFKAFFRFRNYCKKERINCIHAHSSSFLWAVLIKFTLPKIKIIWHDHYGNSEFLEKRPKFLLKLMSFSFLMIIAVNEKLKDWSVRELYCKKVISLNNFSEIVQNDAVQSVLRGRDGKRILCLSNLRPQKNHLLIIEIANLVKKSYPDWSFHLVGKDFNDAYSISIKEEIMRLDLGQQVYLYGAQNEVATLIQQAAFGLLTSFSEGLPVSLLEMGMLGKTVVASQVGDVGKVIINSETGFLISDFNKNDFYRAIEELINDTEVRNTLGNALKSHVAQHFSKEVIVGSYLKTIAELNT